MPEIVSSDIVSLKPFDAHSGKRKVIHSILSMVPVRQRSFHVAIREMHP